MFQTHDGLSKLYEVSCQQLDFLVEQVQNEPAVLGARMMGGGFGGCTINLVHADGIQPLFERISRQYRQQFGLQLNIYTMITQSGTSVVTEKVGELSN